MAWSNNLTLYLLVQIINLFKHATKLILKQRCVGHQKRCTLHNFSNATTVARAQSRNKTTFIATFNNVMCATISAKTEPVYY